MSKEKLDSELSEEQLVSVTGGIGAEPGLVCPHCGSREITLIQSPSKGRLYLCTNCYSSFSKDEAK